MSYLTKSMGSNQHLVEYFFPNGFRVMIVDADPESLKLAGAMLFSCNYKVTLCADPRVALSILRERHQEFDLVVAEVFMPEMDGFELLQAVKSELNIPVVLMASGNDMDMRMDAIRKGAANVIDKPLEQVLVRSIWKNAAWKNISLMAESENKNQEDDEKQSKNDKGKSAITVEENNNDCVSDQEMNNGEEGDHQFKKVTKKNGRLSWTPYLEKLFENALIQLGPDAVPGKIAKLMNVEGVERHHVASHLQKYRFRKQKEALLLQANNATNQVIPTDHMYQTQLQPQPQLELQSQLHPRKYLNFLPNYNHFHPSGVMPHQYAPYQQQAVPNNNPISYTDTSLTVGNMEMSLNQEGGGLNENLGAPTYPQLHHEQYASVTDNLHNISEKFSGFGFENLNVLPNNIFDTNMAFRNEFEPETRMDFDGNTSANNSMLLENYNFPQLQFTDHHENLNDVFPGHGTVSLHSSDQFQNIDHGQHQHVVNEVGSLSNIDASMTFTNLLNMINEGNEGPELLSKNFMP